MRTLRKTLGYVVFAVWPAASVLAQVPDTVWTRTYGGADKELAECGVALSNDYYAIGGYSCSFGYPDDAYIVKLDMNGDTVWTHTYGAATFDYLRGMTESHDSQLVVAGKHSLASGQIRRAWLFKTDDTGAIDWEHNYTGTDDLETQVMAPTADSGFVLAGYIWVGIGNYDFWMLKTDPAGDSVWFKTFGYSGDDRPTAIRQTADGGYLIAGTTTSFGSGDIDIWLVRTDGSGDTLSTTVLGNDGNQASPLIDETNDGNFIVLSGGSNPSSGTYDPYLIKIQPDGDTLWGKWVTFDRSVTPRAICQTPDNGYLLGGSATYDYPVGSQVFLAKLDANADTVWSTSQGGDGADRALFVDEASNHQIIVLGHWYGSTSAAEFYALKFEESILGVRDDLVSLVPDGYTLAQNYPNPFNPRTMIEFSLSRTSDVELDIYNVLGQRITTLLDGPMTPGDYQMPWDGQDSFGRAVASGLYFYRLRAGDFAASRKMILLK